MDRIDGFLLSARTRTAVQLLLALVVILLCWADVSWALRPGLFPILDELSNPEVFLDGSYHDLVHFFPTKFYVDRPIGWALMRLLPDLFGFDYTKQVACSIAIHFANCGLAFLLFRRLGARIPIAVAGIALFGGLWTAAWTATYLGALTDVSCLFFLLASVLAALSARRGATVLSAVLFLAALRTKEFAIATPVLLTVLLAFLLPRMPLRQALASLARRLWMHYVILLVFGLWYVSLYRGYRATFAKSNPYFLDLHASTVLNSFAYYTSLVFGADDSGHLPPLLLALGLGAVLCLAVLRRRAGLAFGVCAYALTLLPVALIQNRTPCYVYAPQVFLILVLCLLAEEGLASLNRWEHVRWIASVAVAVVCLSWCVAFQRSPYFKSRVNWTLGLRRTYRRSAHDVDAQLPPMGPGTHVYVSHSRDTVPWLFVTPCPYLQLVNRQRDIYCVVDPPTDQLRSLYASDPGPKYFVDYHDDGSVTVTDRAAPAAATNR